MHGLRAPDDRPVGNRVARAVGCRSLASCVEGALIDCPKTLISNRHNKSVIM